MCSSMDNHTRKWLRVFGQVSVCVFVLLSQQNLICMIALQRLERQTRDLRGV